MSRLALPLTIAAAIAAAFAWSRARAGNPADIDMGDAISYATVAQDADFSSDEPVSVAPGELMEYTDVSTPDQMLSAFLYMLRASEHVFPRDVENDAAYNIFYGGAYFADMSDHPVLTGEMAPVPLPTQMCINAGYSDGICFSTAAGAYQITRPTWLEFRSHGGPLLPDFSKDSQDELARRILAKIGALTPLYAGDIAGAIKIAGARWASLPGARAKQSQRTLDFELDRFNEGLTVA